MRVVSPRITMWLTAMTAESKKEAKEAQTRSAVYVVGGECWKLEFLELFGVSKYCVLGTTTAKLTEGEQRVH